MLCLLIPHLHFNGRCLEAIEFYERVFNTKVEKVILSDDESNIRVQKNVSHAVMKIHGQKIFLNDRFSNESNSHGTSIHLIVMFESEDELLKSYKIISENSIIIDPLQSLSYSSLFVQFVDKFAIQWGFMIGS